MSTGNGRPKLSEKGLLTPDNCVVALIDLQPQMLFGVANFDRQTVINNNLVLSKAARLFDVPVVLTTVETKGFSGYMWPQIQAVFPGAAADRALEHELVGRPELRGRHPEDRPEEDRPLRPLDRDLHRPGHGAGPPRRLRGLRRGGLLRRPEPAVSRQRHEARDPGGSQARHRGLDH